VQYASPDLIDGSPSIWLVGARARTLIFPIKLGENLLGFAQIYRESISFTISLGFYLFSIFVMKTSIGGNVLKFTDTRMSVTAENS
jgi:hypothetical protein